MKKLFYLMSLCLIAGTSVMVSCGSDDDDVQPKEEEVVETPKVLKGTTWVYGNPDSFSYTLIFETETTGKRLCHNVIDGTAYDTEVKITSYTYQNGKGQLTTNEDDTFEFTVDGDKLSYRDELDEITYVFKLQK